MAPLYLGIDVQLLRPPAWMVLDESLTQIDSGWMGVVGDSFETICGEAVAVVERYLRRGCDVHIGIDSPRGPLPAPREWYWDGKNEGWRQRRPAEKGRGRHCEVIVRSLGLANPQWTPSLEDSPNWMRLGYALFSALEREASGPEAVHEVFPSASYAMWKADPDAPKMSIDVSQFQPGPKDMIDAAVAAMTVCEYQQGRGAAVGDDGFGAIVLPKPITEAPANLLHWPG
ncbi:MAG: hypothetical protein CMO61_10720 [Verrucomicrobiales bacterium]|jgi:predicted nuclease with RNAse H fold|nr:hypothetical protein [Verrucomicrobiales bacterium]|tara:strand:- start:5308 stop:5994 length:687 start_codon:yes stop_codon:yes gene_type:complete